MRAFACPRTIDRARSLLKADRRARIGATLPMLDDVSGLASDRMNYLITGGAGFIGSHLADALLARGDSVVALDDVSTGSIDNVRHLLDHPRFTLREGTVLDQSPRRTSWPAAPT